MPADPDQEVPEPTLNIETAAHAFAMQYRRIQELIKNRDPQMISGRARERRRAGTN